MSIIVSVEFSLGSASCIGQNKLNIWPPHYNLFIEKMYVCCLESVGDFTFLYILISENDV